ncbi:hypothetical protein R1sor_001463 [Riccia sorocarpa]|uniref:PROP1-like PPR domain-containing protein n=1 Tax=Riccia sorocarpa TaxID=122646 RepID=A0ABD3H071_9MARC
MSLIFDGSVNAQFVWRRSAQSLSPTSATLLEPGPSCADANSGSSSAPPTFSDESTPQFPNKFIYRPPVRTVPAASSPEVRKVRIRCSKCGSKSHLWKGCPSDGKCARCSDPENEQPCATVVIRTRMMKDCRDSGDLSKMWTLLRSLKSDGHKPTVHSYSILLSFLVWKGKMQEARKVWETMDEDGVAADAICYNTLLNGWCSAGKLDEAKAVLKEMRTRKFQLTTSTYNTLIKGLGLAGRPAEAMKVLEQMTLKDTAEPNRQTYNILINAWAQVKDIEQARRVLQLMRNAGLSPDVVTYNSLAKAYAELERSFEAEQVINEMKDVYIRPNERTYGIVINSYCETGRPEEGLALLDRMRMDGIRCNLPIYNILIKGFAQLYRPDKVDEVLELMGASGVKPDVQSFSLAMNVWSSAGLVEEARAIFERMQRDYELRPDVTAYTILAKGYVRARRPAEAESLLLEMTDQGLRPNVFTFTTVISGWCNVGNMEEAYRVFKSMETCGVRPNSNTVSTLIWGFSESKQPHRAEEVVEDMKARGIEIDRKCLDLVAEAWRSVGLPAEARRVLRGEVNTATMSSESTLKTRFDSMIAGREILLDSNIHTRVNKEPVFADKQSSLKPPATALTSTVKLRANITAKSLQQRTPCVDPKLKNQVVTVGDKYTRRTLQIRNRLNCREVLVRTSNSIVTLRRATPWVSLVIV